VDGGIFFDTVKQKTLGIVIKVIVATLILCAAVVLVAPLALVRSWTEVVGDVPSPDGKWDVVLMVRNAGAVTDYSTQLSVVRSGSLLREIARCRPGNLFIADGDHGRVAVDGRGFMHVDVVWKSPDLILVTFPANARVYKQQRPLQTLTIAYNN
jgi:hypothetical protein